VPGTSWRAVSAPTARGNGSQARGPGSLTASPGRSGAEGSQAVALGGSPVPGRRTSSGLIGKFFTTPDIAAYRPGPAAGNGIIVDIHCRMKQWSAITTTHWFAAHGDHVFGLDLAWAASIHPNGRMRLAVSSDGTTFSGPEATGGVPFGPGQEGWLRMAYGNFLGLGLFTYAWSRNGTDWTLINTDTPAAYFQLFDTGAALSVPGQFAEPAQEMVVFEVRYTVDSNVVAAPRFDTIPPRQASFRDDYGRLWSASGDGLIAVV
jgi:hypothetical protein